MSTSTDPTRVPGRQAVVDRKHSDSLLAPLERRFAGWLVPLVPLWIETQHLTMLTLLWSALVVAASWLARSDSRWLAAVSVLIGLQYVTDAVDGKVGKMRDAGLVRWGYYMDHLLDYVFLCAILFGYTLLLPAHLHYLMVPIVAVSAGFMVSAFLARGVTGILQISYCRLGPIEMRLAFVALNVALPRFGESAIATAMPYVLAGSLAALSALVYRTQRTLWRLDRGDTEGVIRSDEARQSRASRPAPSDAYARKSS